MTRLIPVLVILLVLPLAGCRRPVLNDEKTFELAPGDIKWFTVPAIKMEQTVKAVLTADQPISAALGFEKDLEAIKKDAFNGKWSDKELAKQSKEKEISFQATIPANLEAVVVIVPTSTKNTSVKLKLTN